MFNIILKSNFFFPSYIKVKSLLNYSLRKLLAKLHLSPGELRFNSSYHLGRLLGKGGYGNVYEGVRIRDGLKVAVKKIPKAKVAHMKDNLPLEVALLNQVDDIRGVVHIIECIDMGDSFAIVFENDGVNKDLFDIILEKGKLNEDFARDVFQQVTRTIIMCHQRGVLHRDIKDENIIIDIKTLEVKLIDFGSGCLVQEGDYNEFEGTPIYAPPEWVKEKMYKAESMTVWQLGILLFDMVSGNLPFLEERDILEGKLEWVVDLSAETRDLIEKCLCQDPRERIAMVDILKHPWFL